MKSIPSDALSPRGWVVYSPPFQSGSCITLSRIIRRIIRLRPAIWVGAQARGTSVSLKSG